MFLCVLFGTNTNYKCPEIYPSKGTILIQRQKDNNKKEQKNKHELLQKPGYPV
jgi:hypothetical protein